MGAKLYDRQSDRPLITAAWVSDSHSLLPFSLREQVMPIIWFTPQTPHYDAKLCSTLETSFSHFAGSCLLRLVCAFGDMIYLDEEIQILSLNIL